MISHVRFFGRDVDPADYRRGFGVLGFTIRLLDALRLWAERRVVLLILRIEMRRRGLTAAEVRAAEAAAKKDPAFDPRAFHHDLRPVSLEEVRNLGLEMRSRETRYAQGRQNTDTSPLRPVPVTDSALRVTLAEANNLQDRSFRYLRGRRTRLVSMEGDFTDVV